MRWLAVLLLMCGCVPSTEPRVAMADRWSAGRAVVERSVRAHGGRGRLLRFSSLRARYAEWWQWPFSWMGQNPWPSNPVVGGLEVFPRSGTTRMVLDEDSGRTYMHSADGLTVSPLGGPKWNPTYALPRTHYLILLPFKFLDAGARHEYLGHRLVDGRLQDEVLISFDEGVGDSPDDRYWALFDAGTGLLTQVSLTVTAYHALALGDVVFEHHRNVQGFILPTVIRAFYTGPGVRVPLHLSQLSQLQFIR